MEKFNLRAKQAIRTIKAIGIGSIMMGATISGAFAATLADYPAPFVANGKFQNVAMVIGDTAGGADSLAVSDITAGLQKKVSSSGSTGSTSTTTATVTSGVTEKVPIDTILASTNNLDYDLTDSNIAYLQDSQINFNSNNYDVSEHIVIDASSITKFATSISSNDDDYATDVRLEIPRNAIRYYYAADQGFNATLASINIPLEIKFLGKNLKITSATDTSITATVGDSYYMTVGQTVTVNGKSVKLLDVASASVIVDIDGVTGTVTSTTKTINGLQVNAQDFFPGDVKADRSANIVVGKTATKTYNNNDAYIDEDESSPNWKWQIAYMGSKTATSITNTAAAGVSVTGMTLGVKSNFLKDSSSTGALKTGECVSMPNSYVNICYDSLTVAEDKYMGLNIEVQSSDLGDYGVVTGSQSAIHIWTDVAEGLVVDLDSTWGGTKNMSAVERKTKDIYLYTNATQEQNSTLLFYYDNDLKYNAYAGNITAATGIGITQFAHLNYDSTKNERALLYFTGDTKSTAYTGNITLTVTEASDWNDRENLTMQFRTESSTIAAASSSRYDRLGLLVGGSTAEGGDLYYVHGATVTQLGNKDKDLRTRYGIVIKNPSSAASSNRVQLKVPGDLLQGVVKVGGVGTTSSSTPIISDTAPTPKMASEISNIADYNAILVGGPCVNKFVAALKGKTFPACGSDSGFEPGKAIIELQTNGNNMAMIVAGWEADDTRRAGVALKYWDDSSKISPALKGMAVTVTGTTTDLSNIQVA